MQGTPVCHLPVPGNSVSRVGQQSAIVAVCGQIVDCLDLFGIHIQFHSLEPPGLKQPVQRRQEKGTGTRKITDTTEIYIWI
jgi:hypothetical protein